MNLRGVRFEHLVSLDRVVVMTMLVRRLRVGHDVPLSTLDTSMSRSLLLHQIESSDLVLMAPFPAGVRHRFIVNAGLIGYPFVNDRRKIP